MSGSSKFLKFTKMHGLGNDYIYVDCFDQQISDPARAAVVLSDRHRGIGGDGLILICPSRQCPVRMRIFNADGSEAEMCGNGLRCVAKFACQAGLFNEADFTPLPQAMEQVLDKLGVGNDGNFRAVQIETGRGILTVGLMIGSDAKVGLVCVNMDQPILEPKLIPVNSAGPKAVDVKLTAAGVEFMATCVSMGNPHAVIFVDDISAVSLTSWGPAIERHELFPQRTNVQFVQVIDRSAVKMIVWERGSGATLASGTSASAVCVAGVLTGRTDRLLDAHLPGGMLKLAWSQIDNCVYMIGPATEVFTGQVDLERLMVDQK